MGLGICCVLLVISHMSMVVLAGTVGQKFVGPDGNINLFKPKLSDNDNRELPLTHAKLDHSLDIDYDNDDASPIMPISVADDIVSSCSAFIDTFSEAAANYTECALKYARPIRFCQQCVELYVKSRELYDIIMKGNPLNDQGDLCSSVILNSDRVQIIVRTGTFLDKLWSDCNCDQCFKYDTIKNNSVTIMLSNNTLEFNKRAQATLNCFKTHSNTSKDGTTIFNSTVCEDCLDIYNDLNSLYNKMETQSGRHVCMDVVDMMNSTRSMWSSLYQCNIDPGSLWPVFVLTGLICLFPVVFYGGTRAHGARAQKNMITLRRRHDLQDGIIGVNSLPSTTLNNPVSSSSGPPNAETT